MEAVLVFRYTKETHNETYGRHVGGGGYSKDFLQFPPGENADRESDLARIFPVVGADPNAFRPVTLVWPGGAANAEYQPLSSDRPHLKWNRTDGTPRPWRMTPAPSPSTIETIPGDPTHTTVPDANAEFDAVKERGAGQPYLVAIKLRGTPQVLNVRVYLDGADSRFAYADLRSNTPPAVQRLIDGIPRRALFGYELFSASDQLYFDAAKMWDAWSIGGPRHPEDDDAVAETLPADPAEQDTLEAQLAEADYSVPDATATTRTRGSAQRVFAAAVKTNYLQRCAVTGISTPGFLVASHIVPWSEDPTIRLDPANGICLSLLIDRAFEDGQILIQDDLTISVDRSRIGDDLALLKELLPYDGFHLLAPVRNPPKADYLRRRRERSLSF